MNEQWINEMRQTMTDYQWPVPEVSWDEIDRAVAANKARKARQLWLRRMAAAAVVLLIAGVGYWGLMRHKSEPIVEKHWAQEQPFINQRGRSHNSGQNQGPVPTSLAMSRQKFNKAVVSIPESKTFASISEEGPDTVTITESTKKEKTQPVGEKNAKPTDKTYPVIYPSNLHQRKHLDNRLTAKVYMSSTMLGNLTESSQSIGSYSTENDPYSPYLNELTKQYVHHRQPVRFGLSLRYRLDNRWSIETGLTYTRLSSDITTIGDDVTTTTEQRLNYIGLPLNISYELWRSRFFGLYVSGGGMIEKMLDASSWQFSLNGAAGVICRIEVNF